MQTSTPVGTPLYIILPTFNFNKSIVLDIDFNSISSAKIDPVNWPPMDKITLFISSIFLHYTIKLKGPKTSFFS